MSITNAKPELRIKPRKWLPVIARDDCVGCNRCVLACRQGCIEMVWDFATLVRPQDCDSCEACEKTCLHDVIRMGWGEMKPATDIGLWREQPEITTGPGPERHWLAKLLG